MVPVQGDGVVDQESFHVLHDHHHDVLVVDELHVDQLVHVEVHHVVNHMTLLVDQVVAHSLDSDQFHHVDVQLVVEESSESHDQ